MAVLILTPNGGYTTKATLAAAVVAADVVGKTIVVTTPQVIDSVTVPSTIALRIENGGSIAINSGKTLTINGPLYIHSANVFTGSGTVVYGSGSMPIIRELAVAVPAANIDLNTGVVFTKTITTNTIFTVSNVPTTGLVGSFILSLTNGGAYTITWWGGLKWPSGVAPSLTVSGRDVLSFFTYDGGTVWTGLLSGKDVK